MQQYKELLLSTPLFKSFTSSELPAALQCLQATTRSYAKEEFIFLAGDAPKYIGILLSGGAQILREDAFGNRSILDTLVAGDMFAEVFAFARVPSLPVSVQAAQPCQTLMLNPAHFTHSGEAECTFHSKLVGNMLAIMAQKALALNATLGHLSRPTLREKLLSYLSAQSQAAGNRSFFIPLNRQQLADYLCADRSALSAELSRMQKDGLIRYHKNQFELL